MQYLVECWANCGQEFSVYAPDRQDPLLVDGVHVGCEHCGEEYVFTVDGDGEPGLESSDPKQLGENISGHGSEESTHY